MIIDCHYHLDPRLQSVENLIDKMDRCGIDKTVLMPVMCDPIPHSREALLKLMRFCLTRPLFQTAAKHILARFTPRGDVILPHGPLKIYQAPDNQAVADAMGACPNRFLGWIFVNPGGPDSPEETYDRFRSVEGFIGVKAHPFWHQYPPSALLPVARKAADHGMPMLIHAGFDANGAFIPLLEELPGLKLILAHAGFPGFRRTWEIIRKRENVWVDLSADAYLDRRITLDAVEYLGPDRCLFGTDGPYGNTAEDGSFDNGFIKRRLEHLFPDSGIQQRLLGGNFLDIVGV